VVERGWDPIYREEILVDLFQHFENFPQVDEVVHRPQEKIGISFIRETQLKLLPQYCGFQISITQRFNQLCYRSSKHSNSVFLDLQAILFH